MNKIIKILANIILSLIKLINWLGHFLFILLYWPFKILKAILSVFYFNLVLPMYRFYLLAVKKLGWSKSGRFQPIAATLVNKNFIHILVVVLSAAVIMQNLTAVKGVMAAEDFIGKTPLAKLVSDELSDSNNLIEEYQTETTQLNNQQTAYLDRNEVLNSQTGITTIEPTPVDEEDTGLIEGTPAMTEDDITPNVADVAKRTESINYTVANGDTASSIANKFGISVNTILWENNLSAKGLIQPGDKLTILPVTGVTYKVKRNDTLDLVANYFEVDKSQIIAQNNLPASGMLKLGQSIIIPGARKITTATTNIAVKPIKTTTIAANHNPVYVEAEEPSVQPVSGSKMVWPTSGHTITQYYSWRHNGLDIANHVGTPIYAADDGTVEVVGYNAGGYGNQIVIDHGNGKKTRYGHLSAFAVKVGASVSKGQYIGAMGSTGRSTGPHLHFEVMIGGRRYNPLSYVAY